MTRGRLEFDMQTLTAACIIGKSPSQLHTVHDLAPDLRDIHFAIHCPPIWIVPGTKISLHWIQWSGIDILNIIKVLWQEQDTLLKFGLKCERNWYDQEIFVEHLKSSSLLFSSEKSRHSHIFGHEIGEFIWDSIVLALNSWRQNSASFCSLPSLGDLQSWTTKCRNMKTCLTFAVHYFVIYL